MYLILEAALPIALNKALSYYCEDSDENFIGKRASVPIGKMKTTAVILTQRKASENDIKDLKPIYKVIDDEPVFTENMIKFLSWTAEYYLCPIGEVFKAAMPAALVNESQKKVKLKREIYDFEFEKLQNKSPNQFKILQLLSNSKNALNINYIKKETKISGINSVINKLIEKNYIEEIEEENTRGKQRQVQFIKIKQEIFDNKDELKSLITQLEKKAAKQAMFLNLFSAHNIKNEFIQNSTAIKEYSISQAVINGLIEKAILETKIDNIIITDVNYNSLSTKKEISLELTEEQQFIINDWKERYNNKELKPALIHGITGSGKTLIYMHLINYIISLGKSAILMVPEIALTPQLIDRFRNAFTEEISVLHSKMSLSERTRAWNDINSGNSKIIIGARSAIFAPCKNLGLIIVDEEHDSSYKQDSPAPRYNARDASIIRAMLEGAHVIMGSATPALETMFNAANGKFLLYKIKKRADGAVLPEINTIDLIEAAKLKQINGSFTKQLLDEIEKRLLKKEGIILLQNRRGFSSFIQCKECGHIPECNLCSVSLTYHKSIDRLRCHYCGATHKVMKTCPVCGSNKLEESGSGTQKVEEELINYFKTKGMAPIISRMDLDTTSKKGSHRKILEDFASAKTDILVGTQMVAKGLDFERVTLVGIINADLQLFIPDFRATERAFQLITQVAGRAGRSAKHKGEVYIQTSKPKHLAIISAQAASYRHFYNEELEHRAKAFYPPYSRLFLIEINSPNRELAIEHSHKFAELINIDHSIGFMLGPVAPVIEKIRANYRRIIMLKNFKKNDPSGKLIRKEILSALEEYNKNFASAKVRIRLDTDSFSTL